MTRTPLDSLRSQLDQPGVFAAAAPDRVLETHISWLFFVGERVFKVKKAIRLPFLDYSTLDRRAHFCREEVRLGRRFAGNVYRGVVGIAPGPDGRPRVLEIDGSSDGGVFEYAVVMERLPADRLLDALLHAGAVDNALIERVVDRLVGFDATAARGAEIARFGDPEVLRTTLLGNFDELSHLADENVLSVNRSHFLRGFLENSIVRQRGLLQRRLEEKRIREGHGDLHAGNLCDLGDRIVAYDCIDFDPKLRCLDSAAEIAFLAMDVEARGFPGFAAWLVHRAAVRFSDPELPQLIPLYTAHYALVRAKVALLRKADATTTSEAKAYLDLATARAFGPLLIMTTGLPGCGKSTFAAHLADRLRATILRSDVIRKERFGMAPSERCKDGDLAGIYSQHASDALYAELAQRARELLLRGHSVVVDAAFPSASRRAPFRELGRELALPTLCLQISAPEAVIVERLARRACDPHEPSDADLSVYTAAKARYEAPVEFGDRAIGIDSTHALAGQSHAFFEQVSRVLALGFER